MATKRKQEGKTSKSRKSPIITDKVGNYEKHPFFVKKANEARDFLSKVGLPKQFTKKKHN